MSVKPRHRPTPQLSMAPPENGARPNRVVTRSRQDQLARVGLEGGVSRDLYHLTLTIPWGWFLLISAGLYLAINVLFAGLYLLQPGSIANAHDDFADAFFFSVQTIATIGYGSMAPATVFANLVVTAETLIGMTLLAITTGVVFARFSRPTARVLFSRRVVILPRDGKPTLTLRMANQRRNQILQANVALTLVRNEMTSEGEQMRRFYDLKPVRTATPVFALSFTVMHVIDEDSPLFGMTPEMMADEDAELVVMVSGIDETVSQTVHARWSYDASEILWNHRFVDILGYLPDGRRAVDFSRFHDTVPI
jgi:inward rectifier potassium channel